jgi:hypothetical protein
LSEPENRQIPILSDLLMKLNAFPDYDAVPCCLWCFNNMMFVHLLGMLPFIRNKTT